MFRRAVGALCAVVLTLALLRPAVAQSGSTSAQRPETTGQADGEPADPASVAALAFDVRRIVAAREAGGWLVDDLALQQVLPDAMASVCRATPATRQAALVAADAEARRWGEPAALFEAAGGRLDDTVEQALSAARRALVLRRSLRRADQQCPFWLRPEPSFKGLQSNRNRLVVAFDTGGVVQFRRTAGEWTLGAGGSGRVLLGYGFTRVTLLAGIEFGGGALLEPDSDPTQFAINYLPALPLIVRLHRNAWHYDLEVAPVALFQARNTELSVGLRGALTVGVSALRVRGIIPWVGVGVAAEHYVGNAARPSATYLRSGLRVGGAWGP